MTHPTYCLSPQEEGDSASPWQWRIGCLDANGSRWVEPTNIESESLEDCASALRASLDEMGYCSQGVVLALPSSMCLPVTIPSARRPKRITPQTLAFAAESELPIEAEALTVATISNKETRGDLLAIAIETAKAQPIIDALENTDIAIEAVIPAAWLAAATAFDSQTDWVIVSSAHRTDGFELSDGKPVRWIYRPHTNHLNSTNTLEAEAKQHLSASLKRWALQHTSDPHTTHLDIETANQRLLESAANQLTGKGKHTPNLRTGPLATHDRLRTIRSPLNAALIALLLLLVAGSFKTWQHGTQLNQLATTHNLAQQAAFRDALPGQAVPLAVRARLLSERNRLRVQAGIQEPGKVAASSWLQLDSILSSLPQDIRFRVYEIRVDETRALIEGEARTHSDADRIAASLRRGGLEVEPPRVSRLDDRKGVRFSLQLTASQTTIANKNVASSTTLPGRPR